MLELILFDFIDNSIDLVLSGDVMHGENKVTLFVIPCSGEFDFISANVVHVAIQDVA